MSKARTCHHEDVVCLGLNKSERGGGVVHMAIAEAYTINCGSKYLAYSRVEVEYQGSSGLLLQPELSE
ncbi:hypothetical protein Tco_0943093 [Tanacetum coccineum]